jgi:hypothetical protein
MKSSSMLLIGGAAALLYMFSKNGSGGFSLSSLLGGGGGGGSSTPAPGGAIGVSVPNPAPTTNFGAPAAPAGNDNNPLAGPAATQSGFYNMPAVPTVVTPIYNDAGIITNYQIPGTTANPAGGIVGANINYADPYSMLPFL